MSSQIDMTKEDFIKFLINEVGIPETKVERLVDGGFDDVDSLELIEVDTLKLLGFKDDAEEIYAKIKNAFADKIVETQVLLNQDGAEIADLQKQMEEMKMEHEKK